MNVSGHARLEMFVEPLEENAPGPHVIAAIEALEAAGLAVDMGPFATTTDGSMQLVIDAAAAMIRAGFEAGAEAIQLRIERIQ